MAFGNRYPDPRTGMTAVGMSNPLAGPIPPNYQTPQAQPQTTVPQPQANTTAAPQAPAQPGVLNPGQEHPYGPGFSLISPPPAPGSGYDSFLPPVLEGPYSQGINTAVNMANWAGQAAPQAAAFQQALYSPGMTPMEQQYLGSSAMLGARQLADAYNRIEGMFENSASHGSLAPALFDATNQFNQQLNQMAGQMGTQRQSMASQLLPFSFGFPIQAYQAAQTGAEGLYGMAQNAMYGDLQFPLAMFGSVPYAPSTTIAQPQASGGKK